MDPRVSVPIENATQPAAVADPGPAEDPLDPQARFHGFSVRPRYQRSPRANSPVASFAMRTAPAAFSRRTTSASSSIICVWKAAEPQVVRAPTVEKRSFTP